MHCFVKFVLLLISLVFVQGLPVIPEIHDLNGILSSPDLQQYLSTDKSQELRREVFATTLKALTNRWDVPAIAQALEQLVTQYVPQVKQMNIDWNAVGQSALNNIITASDVRSGAPGDIFRKRDLEGSDLQLLSQLSLDQLSQIAETAAIPNKAVALARLRLLLQQFFPGGLGRTDFDEMAENLLNNLNTMLPHLNHPNFSYSN